MRKRKLTLTPKFKAHLDRLHKNMVKHGKCNSPEYRSYRAMLARCYNPKHTKYADYGGKNIVVCAEWRESFVNFYRDMGDKPTPYHTIDRIDGNGPYSPDNCRWATPIEQQNNIRSNHLLTYDGKTASISEWSRIVGISKKTLWNRLNRGWTIADALTVKPGTKLGRYAGMKQKQ